MDINPAKRVLALVFVMLAATAAQSYALERAPTLAERQAKVAKGKYVIAIGIDDYASPDIADLRFCEADARLLVETLIFKCAYPEDTIRTLLGKNATHNAILHVINAATDKAGNMERDTIIFYYCGHAMCSDGENSLLPWNGSVVGDSLNSKNIPLSWIKDKLAESGFNNQVVILDVCRGELTNKNNGKATGCKLDASIAKCHGKGMRIFLASESGKLCPPSEELGHGLFTYALAKGISGSVHDNTGLVTLGNLEEYIRSKLKSYCMANPEYEQIPVSFGQAPEKVELAAFNSILPGPNRKQVTAHMSKGYGHYNRGHYEEALSEFRTAAELELEFAPAYCWMGHAYCSLGCYEKAVESYKEAIRLHPSSHLYRDLGLAFVRLGRYDEAITNCEEAIRLKPWFAPYYCSLGYVYSMQGDYENAIDKYLEATEVHPQYAVPHYRLGRIYLIEERYEKAVTHLEEAIRLDPADAKSRLALGRLYYNLEDFDKARTQFQKLLQLDEVEAWTCRIAISYLKQLDQD